ncbi:MAG: cytochrome c-type biogenesis CcmF C-terminal domain-containing protein, partial [bacterium]
FNNLILVGMAFAVFWGTIFPIISEAVRGVKITVGPPFFNQVNVPIGLALLLLTGICPLIAWRKASQRNLRRSFTIPLSFGILAAVALFTFGITSIYPLMSFAFSAFVLVTIIMEFYRGTMARARISGRNVFFSLWDLTIRNKRRYGGYTVHLGVIMIFVGITGSSAFQKENTATMSPGSTLKIAEYTLHYEKLIDQTTAHAQQVAAKIRVEKAGQEIGVLYPSKLQHKKHEPVSEVAIRQTLKEDLYLILAGWDEQDRASIKALVNPLVAWIWVGGVVMIIGTLIALGPEHFRRQAETVQAKISRRKSMEVEHAA